jgi:hypothetical protein
MAKVQISKNLTEPGCRARAGTLSALWQRELSRAGSGGVFQVEHGKDHPCNAVHGASFNGGLWIVTVQRGCGVLRTRAGRVSDYVGAGRVERGDVPYFGPCGGKCRH